MTTNCPEPQIRAELEAVLSEDGAPTSKTRNRQLESCINRHAGLTDTSTYAARISLSRNVSVRFSQTSRALDARILVAIVPVDDDSTELEAIIQSTKRYLERDRPDCECIIIQHDGKSVTIPAVVYRQDRAYSNVSSFVFHETKRIETKPKAKPPKKTGLTFAVVESDHPVDRLDYPYAVLRRDQWDDYGWKSLFHLTIHLSADSIHPIGPLKILRRGQPAGPTEMPNSPFPTLSSDYFSLGQSYSYYERIASLPSAVHEAALTSLRDIVRDPRPIGGLSNEPAYTKSLLRTGAAVRALADSPDIFKTSQPLRSDEGLAFKFSTSVGGNDFSVDFSFNDTPHLPSRMNALIGFNGSGKTQLLANLALVATGDLEQRDERRGHGELHEPVRFSAVIAISYSAFDTFDMPNGDWRSDQQRNSNESSDIFGYSYIGLRKAANHDSSISNQLKSINEIDEEFYAAIAEATTAKRKHALHQAMRKLLPDPSFGRTGLASLLTLDPEKSWRETFSTLSTGHKIVLNTVAQLVAKCAPKALVLIDEPESHLHPSLLSAFIQATGEVLRSFDSYAIVTTHSPVVLQEIPRRYVRIISRYGSLTRIEFPTMETFGENIGTLTREAFDLDNTQSDYHATLRQLSEEMSLEQIEDLFDGELSGNARSYLLALRRSRRQGLD